MMLVVWLVFRGYCDEGFVAWVEWIGFSAYDD